LLAGGDRELLVGVAGVSFDGSSGDEQVLRDVAVAETGGGELGNAMLARRQRVKSTEDGSTGSPAGGNEFCVGSFCQR